MNETDFNKFLNSDIYELKPEQLERLFKVFYEMFDSRYYSFGKSLPADALAWRTKQAHLLLKHRNDKKLPPRR